MNLRPPRSGSMNSGGGSLLHSSPNQISPGKQSIKRVIKLDGVFSSFKFALAFSQESKFQFLPKRQIFHRQPIHSRPQLKANLLCYFKLPHRLLNHRAGPKTYNRDSDEIIIPFRGPPPCSQSIPLSQALKNGNPTGLTSQAYTTTGTHS